MATTPTKTTPKDEPAPTPPIGDVVEKDLPEPARLRKLIGPSVILVGVGVASGEYILFPYIASEAGLAFLWAAVVGVAMQFFINMEIERYTLATGQTAITGFSRLWKPWGLILVLLGAARHRVARLGDERRDRRHVRVRRRQPDDDRRHRAVRHRRHADRVAGRLPDRREARVPQGRRDPRVHRRRPGRRDHERRLQRHDAGRHEASAPSRARSSWRSSSARSPRPARAAPTTSCRATGSATRASAWAATRRASPRRSPARRRPRPRASSTASRRTRRTWRAGACGGSARTSSSSSRSP